MEGFFTRKETESVARPDGKIYSCASCGLGKEACHPKMKPSGNFHKGILNIGSINSELDDKKGIQWQGTSGRLLQQTYEKLGIDLHEDCLNINAINCYAEEVSKNASYQIACCRKGIFKLINEYHPDIIVLFGTYAIESVIGHRWKKDLGDINKWRGWAIPDKDLKAWICPVFHPSQIDSAKPEIMTIWKQDLENAIAHCGVPLPKYIEPNITILEDLSELSNITADTIAFDYETTGLKPQAKGHRIICASVATSQNDVFVFMMPQSKNARKPFTDLLKSYLIGKMAHNMKFEDTWTAIRLRTDINNWQWDSMLAAHQIDNRPGITGLKFQTFINFGVVDYDSEIYPYLQSGEKDGNAFNRIEDLIKTTEGIKKLLTYCALDSIYEFRLAMLQQKQMNYSGLPF